MRRLALAAACGTLLVSPAIAQTPLGTSFTYQGRLVESGSPANGTYDLRFILYDAPAGGNQVGPVVTRDDVFVSTGLFTVGIDFGAVSVNQRRFLEVGVRPGASTGAYDVVSGRHELTAAPSALFGASAPWTGVTGKPAGFADDVDNDLMAALVCSNGQVAKSNGTTWLCGADLNTSFTAGTGIQISAGVISIPSLAITNALLADNAVTQAKIADNAVSTTKLLDAAVNTAKLADNAVATAKLADFSVATAKLANAGVTSAKIANNAVTSLQLADNAVSGPNILDNSITAAKLAPASVGSTEIIGGSVQSTHIQGNAVTLAAMADNSVSSLEVVNDSLTFQDIGPNAISSSEISGTEVALYQMAGGCGNAAQPTFSGQCATIPCGGGLFNNCAGSCNSGGPLICTNNVIGYLLSASIP